MADIIEIQDFEDERLDMFSRLTEAQLLNRHEPEKGIFIAESPLVIERALDAGCEPIALLMEKRHVESQGKEIIQRCGDIPVYVAEFSVLTQITGFKLTRGMLCAMRRPVPRTIEQVCQDASRIVVMERVMNPTNIGAIFRSAAALNMDGVLLSEDCSDPLYRRGIRVSMGTVFQIPWAFCLDPVKSSRTAIRQLKNMGFHTVAMALRDDSYDICDKELTSKEKLAVIMGSEGDGLDQETIDLCDYTVKIPMAHGVDSLNVAAASAVAFWELGKNNH